MTPASANTGAQRLRPTTERVPILVLIYLFCVVVPINFYLGPIYMTTLRLILLLVTVPLLLRLLAAKDGPRIWTDWLFLAHVLWIVVAIGKNNPSQVIQQAPSVGVEFLGGYVLARTYVRTPEMFLAVFRVVMWMVLISMPVALLEAKTGHPYVLAAIRAIPGITSMGIVTIEGRMGLERVQAMFAHPIHYGLFCSIAFSMVFVAMKDEMSTARRYVTGGAVAFCGFLALSSGALLAIALQFALITWAAIFAKYEWRWRLLIGIFAVAWVAIDLMSNRSPMQVFMSYATFSPHNAYWRAIIFEWGMKNVWANPIFGIGLNDWVRPWFMRSGSMDNFWLVMGVRYGIPGFLLIAAGWLLALVAVMRRPFRSDRRVVLIRRAYVFTLIGLTFTLGTVHIWTNIFSFVFFSFGAGVWMIHWQEEAEQAPPPAATPRHAGPTRIRPAEGRGPIAPVYTRYPAQSRAPAFTRSSRTQS